MSLSTRRSPALVILVAGVFISVLITLRCVEKQESPPLGSLIATAAEADEAIMRYLSDKSWGFFGATCDQWLSEDYELSKKMSKYEYDSDVWRVVYTRSFDRIVGSGQLIFMVDASTGSVKGMNERDDGRFGVAEGCDKW